MPINSIRLDGCSPTPLASYLKALGILRLISSDANHVDGQAADPQARGWWKDELFHLRTRLSRDDLIDFFLHQYAPTPIIAPWNGRAGFLEGDAGADSTREGALLMCAIQQSSASRLATMRRSIETLRANPIVQRLDKLRADTKRLAREIKQSQGEKKDRLRKEEREAKREEREQKLMLLPSLRSITDPSHLAYLDTCYALSTRESPAPLLGSGGVDGSREFGVNFARRLKDVFDFNDGSPKTIASGELIDSLFALGGRLSVCETMGQFSPGQGGPNITNGYEGKNPLNCWNVLLAIEGAVVFAGAITRRWGANKSVRAAFPFTFDVVRAGAGVFSSEDPNYPRAEIWTPFWAKPATFSEMFAIFSEGRLTLGHRVVSTGLDAARSVAQLGQSRGIVGFERYTLIQPGSNKDPYQATPLGRFIATEEWRPDLVQDLEVGDWLDRAKSFVRGKSAAASSKSAMQRLEDALFQMTDIGQAANGTSNALIALGRFVGHIAKSSQSRKMLNPPPYLSQAWIKAADDASPEYRIAVALAGIGVQSFPMASHFAPVEADTFGRRRFWSNRSSTPEVVWGKRDLISNLIAVLERRLVDASMMGTSEKPLSGATHAGLEDVVAFLTDGFDDARCADLLAGLVWVRPRRLKKASQGSRAGIPFAYAALKPIFASDRSLRRIGVLAEKDRLPIPSGLLPRLRAAGSSQDGRAINEAVRIALARARGSGATSPFDAVRSGGRRPSGEVSLFGAGLRADRLAASMLIPISDYALKSLWARAYTESTAEQAGNQQEHATDGA